MVGREGAGRTFALLGLFLISMNLAIDAYI